MTAKVRFGYRDVSMAAFTIAVSKIENALEAAEFAAVIPSAAEVKPMLNKFIQLQHEISSGNKGLIPQRNELRIIVTRMVSRQCAAVNVIADGDLQMLHESGFLLCRERGQATAPEVVERINLTNVEEGVVEVSYKTVKKRATYVVQMRIEDGDWETVEATTARNIRVSGMKLKDFVYFRVRAVNTAGSSEWSAPSRILIGI